MFKCQIHILKYYNRWIFKHATTQSGIRTREDFLFNSSIPSFFVSYSLMVFRVLESSILSQQSPGERQRYTLDRYLVH